MNSSIFWKLEEKKSSKNKIIKIKLSLFYCKFFSGMN